MKNDKMEIFETFCEDSTRDFDAGASCAAQNDDFALRESGTRKSCRTAAPSSGTIPSERNRVLIKELHLQIGTPGNVTGSRV